MPQKMGGGLAVYVLAAIIKKKLAADISLRTTASIFTDPNLKNGC